MPKSGFLKVIVVIAVGAILALIVAAPLVAAQNTNKKDSDGKQKQSSQQTPTDAQTADSNSSGDQSPPGTSDDGVHWAAIVTDNGTPAVRHASDSSTTVASSSGNPGAYTVTFPTEVHILACTATINSGTPGAIYCGAGEDTGLNPNQLKVQTTDANNNPSQGSGFTVAAYSSASSESSGGGNASQASSDQKNQDQKNK